MVEVGFGGAVGREHARHVGQGDTAAQVEMVVFDAVGEGEAVVVKDTDGDQGFAHGEFLVAVFVGAVDERRHVLGDEHLAEARNVFLRPERGRLTDDLGGARPDGAGPGGLDGTVFVGVAAGECAGPRIHNTDGVARVFLVAGDVPCERVGVGGCGVASLVLTAEIGF
jgi:hypothetical protein